MRNTRDVVASGRGGRTMPSTIRTSVRRPACPCAPAPPERCKIIKPTSAQAASGQMRRRSRILSPALLYVQGVSDDGGTGSTARAAAFDGHAGDAVFADMRLGMLVFGITAPLEATWIISCVAAGCAARRCTRRLVPACFQRCLPIAPAAKQVVNPSPTTAHANQRLSPANVVALFCCMPMGSKSVGNAGTAGFAKSLGATTVGKGRHRLGGDNTVGNRDAISAGK